jgi:ybaK/ebsC protein
MGKKDDKTNVLRILDSKKMAYEDFTYDRDKLSASEVAESLGQAASSVFKTLVTVGKSKEYYVFMIPGETELDLKKAAKAAKEKSLEMIHQKELLPLTGYIHGGCSPIGMKKQFKTFIDSSATTFDKICFSAGKVGHQVQLPLTSLAKVIRIELVEVTKTDPNLKEIR